MDEIDDATAEEHFKLLQAAGLIEYEVAYSSHGSFYTGRLTWQGHEFIESVQDDALYRRAIGEAQKSGAVSFEIIKFVIAELVKRSIFPE